MGGKAACDDNSWPAVTGVGGVEAVGPPERISLAERILEMPGSCIVTP